MNIGKLNVLIDVAWGSSGKGKLAAWLSRKYSLAASVCAHGPNAGHTHVEDNGDQVMVRFIPSSLANASTRLLIGPEAVLDVDSLIDEMQRYLQPGQRLHIHPHAAVVTNDHASRAKVTGQRIAGTQKGTGHALSDKLLRKPEATLAMHDHRLQPYLRDTSVILRDCLINGGTCLAETAQGFDLSLNWGMKWPYATSRDVTVGQALNNAGVGHRWLGSVWGTIRPFPIRVGHIYTEPSDNNDPGKAMVGWSGPCWPDQHEVTWDEVTHASGSPTPLLERTTVTKRVRRVFTFSRLQLHEFCRINEPSHLFVNFIQYLDWSVAGTDKPGVLMGSRPVREFITECENIARQYNPSARVALVGTGARHSEMVEI